MLRDNAYDFAGPRPQLQNHSCVLIVTYGGQKYHPVGHLSRQIKVYNLIKYRQFYFKAIRGKIWKE